ncbi:MAG: hypothetical protein ABIV43_02415 [Candidatus Saccharimonadales bacterium]
MRQLVRKIKPASGFAHIFYLVLLTILPVSVFIFVRLDFLGLALLMTLLSKWRMFAVKPRFWASNVRANSVDIMVGISIVLFMSHSQSLLLQIGWVVAYAVWLMAIKPGKGIFRISVQAGIAQLAALSALYLVWPDGPLVGLTFLTGLICFLSARHYFDSFSEPYARMLAFVWGYFGAALAWLLGHWLLYYRFVGQPTLLLTALGYGMAVIYYLDHHDRLSKGLRRQFVFIMIAIVLVVLTFSDWGDKIVG